MKKGTKWDDIGFVISSNYRKKVLKALDTEKQPSELSKELNINKTHISRTLNELESKGMIKCLNPNLKKGKLYVISDYGKEILKEVKKR